VLWLVAEILSPDLRVDAAEQLGVIAAHPDRWYWYTVLLVAGLATCIPATLGIARLAASRLARVGAVVFGAGVVIAVGDAMAQLYVWQMVSGDADRTQMAALMDRFEQAPGAAAVFGPGGLAYVVGTVLLTVALLRSHSVPAWVAVAFGAGLLLNIAGFVISSVPLILASCVVLLVGMGLTARRLLEA
jgi:hypothetical protein